MAAWRQDQVFGEDSRGVAKKKLGNLWHLREAVEIYMPSGND